MRYAYEFVLGFAFSDTTARSCGVPCAQGAIGTAKYVMCDPLMSDKELILYHRRELSE